jgi:hypothetical protein
MIAWLCGLGKCAFFERRGAQKREAARASLPLWVWGALPDRLDAKVVEFRLGGCEALVEGAPYTEIPIGSKP